MRTAGPYKTRLAAGVTPDGLAGEVPERSIGAVSKTVVPFTGTEGSNPSLSAIEQTTHQTIDIA